MELLNWDFEVDESNYNTLYCGIDITTRSGDSKLKSLQPCSNALTVL